VYKTVEEQGKVLATLAEEVSAQAKGKRNELLLMDEEQKENNASYANAMSSRDEAYKTVCQVCCPWHFFFRILSVFSPRLRITYANVCDIKS
jgi:hypothetical protein